MSKGVHRFALLVAGATFFLIIAGANVTSHDAGLATSDWPLSNGQFFPKMVGNLFWEHGHRLVATTVGILTIVLAFYLQVRERRAWVKRLGWIALGGVVAQGLLGGLTVKLNLPLAVSAAHATLAQLFFLTTVSLAVFTSRSWIEPPVEVREEGTGVSLRTLCVVALVAILAQLVLGATLRHSATWDQPLPTGFAAQSRSRRDHRHARAGGYRSHGADPLSRGELSQAPGANRRRLVIRAVGSGSNGVHRARGIAERSAAAESDDFGDGRTRRLWRAGFRGDDRFDVESIPNFASGAAGIRTSYGLDSLSLWERAGVRGEATSGEERPISFFIFADD